MKRIGMMVAVEIEAVLSKYGQPERCEECCGFEVMKYDCKGYELLIVKSGEGEIAAAAATQHLISKYGVNLIVNFGVVGGLTPEQRPALSKELFTISLTFRKSTRSRSVNIRVMTTYIFIPMPSFLKRRLPFTPSLRRSPAPRETVSSERPRIK